MLSSIGPLGERARGASWGATLTAYTLFSTLGGAAFGLVGHLLGLLIPDAVRTTPWGVLGLAALFAAGVVLDRRSRGHGVASWRRQVDRDWIGRYRGWVVGVGFGAQLGFGLVTIITSTTTYAALLLAAWAGDLRVALLIGAVFGVVRALPLVAMTRVRDWAGVQRVMERLLLAARPVEVAAMVALAVAALVTAAGAVPRLMG